MIVDERLVTYINSLDTGNTEILDEIEREALETYVPIVRKEMQSFLKLILSIKRPARILEVGTAVGFSVATPHAKSEGVKYETLAFAHLKKPIVWDGKEEVSIIFMIGVPSPAAGNRHLEILASLFRKVIYDDFREKLVEAKKPEEIVSLLEAL